jgi:hypothetical protein
VVSVEGPPVIE